MFHMKHGRIRKTQMLPKGSICCIEEAKTADMNDYEKRLYKLMREAVDELHRIGIYPSDHIVSISENHRAKKRLGCCRKIVQGGRCVFTLEISSQLQEETDKKIKEVILHELLHTCRDCLNHGKRWKELAEQVNRKYGYTIKRTSESDRTAAAEAERNSRYKLICRSCGNVGYRIRKSRVIVHPEDYKCAKCGGKITVIDLGK